MRWRGPVRSSQSTPRFAAPEPLAPGAAALALSLCDFETPLWLDPALSTEAVRDYLRFHTGAPIVAAAEPPSPFSRGRSRGLDLAAFSLGSLEYPDRSATLIVQLRSLAPAAAGG